MQAYKRWHQTVGTLCLLTLTTAATCGCAGQYTYPVRQNNEGIQTPASWQTTKIVEIAMAWTLRRYPPRSTYTVNMPMTFTPEIQTGIVQRLPSDGVVLTSETLALPVYHVSQIWLRGDEATVQILRPLAGLKTQDAAAYQATTLRLRGGVHPWRIVSSRASVIGAVEPPPLRPVALQPETHTAPAAAAENNQ